MRTDQPVLDPAWNVKPVTLEDLVLAYLSNPRRPERVRSHGLRSAPMIRFTWMQFRVQALLAMGGLMIAAIVLALTGPNLVHLYDTTVVELLRSGRLLGGDRCPDQQRRQGGNSAQGRRRGGAGPHRALLGSTSRRPGARDRHLPSGLDSGHPHPLDCRQARPPRLGEHGSRRCSQPHGHVVVQPTRSRPHDALYIIRPAWPGPGWLCRLRLRPWRDCRRAHPADSPRDGRGTRRFRG